MPTVHVIPMPAALVIARHVDGEVLVLVDDGQPWRRIVSLVRLLLPRHERREVYRALLG